jgi:hypothetical protein
MSLVRLLTTGKSLIGLQSPDNRYRMRSRYLLPKFGSAKNPFAESGESNSAPVSADTAEPAAIAKYQMSPSELAAARLKETKRLPAATIAAFQAADAQAAAEARSAWSARFKAGVQGFTDKAVRAPIAWIKQWIHKLDPFARWARRKSEAKPAIPPFNKVAPLQGELSLDKIKVVRNDLNEADVEVVPVKATVAKARTAPAAAPVVAPEPEPELVIPDLPPATQPWEFLGERIMAKK